MKTTPNPSLTKSKIVAEIPAACLDESAAVAFIERLRWGDEPCCPRCGETNVYSLKDRKTGERNKRFLWGCRGCRKQFTVRIGTIFEESLVPLHKWAHAFWSACASKKGISALQMSRELQVTYKTALFMMHRIRHAMADIPGVEKLGGVNETVEADETYLGGRPRYHRKIDQQKGVAGRGTKRPVIFALVERDGRVRAMTVPNVTGGTLRAALLANASTESRLITDEFTGYPPAGRDFKGGHEKINHRLHEYARGDIYTNTAESFFALLKRGIHGTFHSVSRKHLHRYVSEFQFRWDTRKLNDGERLQRAILKANGKRLTYREPVRKPPVEGASESA